MNPIQIENVQIAGNKKTENSTENEFTPTHRANATRNKNKQASKQTRTKKIPSENSIRLSHRMQCLAFDNNNIGRTYTHRPPCGQVSVALIESLAKIPVATYTTCTLSRKTVYSPHNYTLQLQNTQSQSEPGPISTWMRAFYSLGAYEHTVVCYMYIRMNASARVCSFGHLAALHRIRCRNQRRHRRTTKNYLGEICNCCSNLGRQINSCMCLCFAVVANWIYSACGYYSIIHARAPYI